MFDNDGVLVDSHDEVVEAWSRMCGEYGLDYDALADEILGSRAIDTLSRLLEPEECAAAYSALERYELDLAASTSAIPGARELLSSVPVERRCLVTSAPTELALARLAGAQIPSGEFVVTGDDVIRGKPDPEPYLSGAAKLGVDPADCVVFEDSPAGGASAMAAGARVVAVGDVVWAVEPIARIPDLRAVAATEVDGSVNLTITLE